MYRLQSILERTRKELIQASDPLFINHKKYTKELPIKNGSGVIYREIHLVKVGAYSHYEVVFDTDSATFPGESYEQKIILKDLRPLIRNKKSDMTLKDKVMYAINNGDLLVGCQDPSFLFWGYRYILTALGSIHPEYRETRQPKIRNPQERGALCKHLHLCLQTLPFLSTVITKDLKDLL